MSNNTDMEILKPCPFCNGEAYKFRFQETAADYARCNQCGAEARLAVWNARSAIEQPSEVCRLRSALEAIRKDQSIVNAGSTSWSIANKALAKQAIVRLLLEREVCSPEREIVDPRMTQLWMLLDDIDTLDDAAKGDDAAFRKACYRIQQKRWAIHNPDNTRRGRDD